jgi:fumarate hydratase subunit beta
VKPPLLKPSPSPAKGFVSKVVIPVNTGIQIDIIRHEFWIPTCVGMTEKLKNGTYNTSPLPREGDKGGGLKNINSNMVKKITLPLAEKSLPDLKAGDNVLLSGVLYVARDAAHTRLVAALERGESLPFDIRGQTLYYMGPSPARPGRVIGAAGPTTSARLDEYTSHLLDAGLRGMIGKGARSAEVKDAMKEHKAVYLAAVGGAGALISKSIIKSEVVAYEDLGPEAVLRLEVKDFPATVVNDIHGGDLYAEGKARYRVA